jgi:hypothetical protein
MTITTPPRTSSIVVSVRLSVSAAVPSSVLSASSNTELKLVADMTWGRRGGEDRRRGEEERIGGEGRRRG